MILIKESNCKHSRKWGALMLPFLLLAVVLQFGRQVLSVQAEAAAPDTGICSVDAAGTTPHATIQNAVDDPLCDVVVIDAGTYYENITITQDIDILGAGPGLTIIYGNTPGKSVFKLIDETMALGPDLIVSLSDMTIQGGSGAYGGGIYNCQWCRLVGDNLEMEGNNVSSDGGAIYNIGVMTITNSSINGNGAASGGGIYSEDSIVFSPALFMSNCEIVGNYATGTGGGIWVTSRAEINNSFIFDNRSDLNAGGIWAGITSPDRIVPITITESIIRENISGYTAGIVVNNHVQIDASQIISNTGGKTLNQFVIVRGGGIALTDSGALTLTNSTVSNNVLEPLPENQGCGGGIYVNGQDAQLLMVNTTVSDNDPGGMADSNCGFNVTNSTAAVTIRSSDISHNLGQGIFGLGTLTVNNSQIHENTGTGISYHSGIVTLKNSLVNQNGGHGISGNDVTINHSTIRDNAGYGVFGNHLYMVFSTVNANNNPYEAPAIPGGGVTGEDVEIRASAIYNNYSDQDGGGIYVTGVLTVVNSTISDNTTNGSGGGIALDGSSVDSRAYLDSATVTENTADLDADETGAGGGIYQADAAHVFFSKNSIIAGNHDLSLPPLAQDHDCFGTFTTGTKNLIGYYPTVGDHCTGFSSAWDLRNVDPLLQSLADNGGPTWTHALGTGSPAIDSASSPAFICQEYDQRGADRDATCDIGAYEVATCDPAVVPTLTVLGNGLDIKLDWEHEDANREVEIRRGTDPHVFSSFATIATNLTANTSYTDYDAIGDYTTNYFYMVRGQNACGANSGWSNRVGEYDFRLNANQAAQIFASTGVLRYLHFAMVSIPLEGADLPTSADEVAAYVDPDGGVRGVAKWNPQTRSWIVRRVGSPFGTPDYAVAPGDVLFLGMVESAPDTFAWVGDLPAVGSIQNNLISDAPNTLIVPLDQTGAFDMTADGLAAEIGGVTHVGVWSTAQQRWYLRIVGQSGINFTIYPGQPYGIRTGPTTPTVWP